MGKIQSAANRKQNHISKIKPSILRVIQIPENKLKHGSPKRNADLRLIKTANEAIINSNCDKNEDLGIQTVVKTKNAVVTSSRTAKKTVKAGKKAVKTARYTIKAGKRAVRTAIKTVHAVKTAAMLLSNPVVLKAILITSIVAVVLIAAIAVISSIAGIFSSLTFSSKSNDLTETHKYITELDTDLLLEINKVESRSKWSSIDEFHYYTDIGRLKGIDIDEINITTDTTKLIAYLTSIYDDFSFKSVKKEIQEIHSKLYKISYKEWEEEETYYTTSTDPATGEESRTKHTKTVDHLDITLKGILFDDWLELHGNLDALQKERYENILACGGSTMLKCYGSPFADTDWRQHLSSRFGYRLDPVSEKKAFHNGIDISLPSGTEINSVSDGIAKVGYDPNGYGKYVTITATFNGNTEISFLYGHCKTVLVTDGQAVKKGDVIATVGSTGKSTGNHLHLTYMIDGTALNPEFYLE